MVIISHSNDLESRYAHMDSDIWVKKGDRVERGEKIGKVGPKYIEDGKLNGATTGVHLHLGISRNGKFINPLDMFWWIFEWSYYKDDKLLRKC